MFGNTNAFSLLAISPLLLSQFSEALAIGPRGISRKDISAIVRRSEAKAKRQEGAAPGLAQPIWLSEDGLYYYANVSLGTPPQALTLALSMEGPTWAPTLPAGVDAETYCSISEYEAACRYASVSGFYTIPGSVTYATSGDYRPLKVGEAEINAIDAFEHIQLGNDSLANVGVAIANIWDSAPLLSLNPSQGNNSGPQLLKVLEQANYANTLTYALSLTGVDEKGKVDYSTGEITFGAIDETQFFGELASFDVGNDTAAGAVPVSNVYWIDSERSNVSVIANETEAGHLGVGQISFTPYLWLQDAMFDIIISLFGNVEKSEKQQLYTRNCSAPLSDINIRSIQLSIDGTVITIPIESLFVTLENAEDICTVAVRPISQYTSNTTADYILGFPFIRSAYTVLDHTNKQTLVAPRRVVASKEPVLTPVGVDNERVSGTGQTQRLTLEPVTTTLTAPLSAETSGTPTDPDTPSSTSHKPPATSTTYTYVTPPPGPNVGGIVGGVVGAIVLIALVIVIYPLKKMRDSRKQARRRRAERAAERASAAQMSPVDMNSGDAGEDDDNGEKDAEALATAIAIEESKKDAALGEAAGRDSVTVNVTELDRNSSSMGGSTDDSNSQEVKSVNTSNTFGENEKTDHSRAR